jgi:hypothetical protein
MQPQEKEKYTAADCIKINPDLLLGGKVVAIHPDIPVVDQQGQIHFCYTDCSLSSRMIRPVLTVSLSSGERCQWFREDVIGVLKSELLTDEAKLHLSQIRSNGAGDVQNPEYSGYCYLEDGRFSAGVWLRDPQEAVEYARMQAPYQHRVLICDSDDFAMMEMFKGELAYPPQERLAALLQGISAPEQTVKMT